MFSDGRVPNFTEAVKLGLIDLKTGMYHDPHTGQRMFLSDAVKKGLIDTTGEMPLIGEDVSSYTLSQAIEMGIFDEETGIVIDPDTNEEMTLKDAVVRGLIYKDSVIYDVETMRLITLERAIKSGMIDGRTGRLVLNISVWSNMFKGISKVLLSHLKQA